MNGEVKKGCEDLVFFALAKEYLNCYYKRAWGDSNPRHPG